MLVARTKGGGDMICGFGVVKSHDDDGDGDVLLCDDVKMDADVTTVLSINI